MDENISIVSHGRRLPFWQQPRSAREAIAKINNASRDWEKTTEDFVYRAGKWFRWLKHKLPHGEFESAVSETRFKIRTVRNFMNYSTECDSVNRVLPYHPNPKAGIKSATVAVLESPEDPEYLKRLKKERPQHDSEPLAWSAAETADKLLEIFEKLTQNRKIEEMEDTLAQFEERVREYIESRREDRLMIRRGAYDDPEENLEP